jgi:hypothetical protein
MAGGRADSARIEASRVGKSLLRSCAAETLTAIFSGWPMASHAAPWRQARRSTHSPSGWISPELSACGINTEGDRSLPSSRRTRSSASVFISRWRGSSNTGW